jgi:hypothetical protein
MYTVCHVDKIKFELVINYWTNEILVPDIRYTDVCYLGVLGLSFSTHSRLLLLLLLFSSEYSHYKIFINEECLEN